MEIYWPDVTAQAPMVIIVPGFMRHPRNMSGWGQHLAQQGFVAVVPDLPTHSDHARNGRFLSELRDYLSDVEPWRRRIDPTRTGYLGFSAGGLSSLLAAPRSPGLAIWVGLDPVDRDGAGSKVAPTVLAQAVVLTAEPSACNVRGNALNIVAALPHPEHHRVTGAVHVDAEWPTTRIAELVCGRSTEGGHKEFRTRATNALREAFSESF